MLSFPAGPGTDPYRTPWETSTWNPPRVPQALVRVSEVYYMCIGSHKAIQADTGLGCTMH